MNTWSISPSLGMPSLSRRPSYYAWIYYYGPTDFYYESPDYDWMPEFACARLSFDFSEELLAYKEKVENWYEAINENWIENVSLAGGKPYDNYHYFGEMMDAQVINFGLFNGYSIHKFQNTLGTFTADVYWQHLLNGNTFWDFIACTGSGDAIQFDDETEITGEQLLDAPVNSTIPIVVSTSSYNGSYDSDLDTRLDYDHSFAECLLRSQGAGLAYVGGVRRTHGNPVYHSVDGNLEFPGGKGRLCVTLLFPRSDT